MRQTHLSIALATCLATTATAQIAPSYPDFEPGAELKDGYSAEELRDAEIFGKDGNRIADVEDVVIGPDGKIARLVVVANEGLFGTGGRRLAVDWKDVEVSQRDGYDIERITVETTEGNVEQSGIFKDGKKALRGGPNEWRATELIGDDVDLEGSTDDGYISDVMFTKDAEVRAVAATTALEDSVLSIYAPYSDDEGWEPGDDFYVVPYSEKELRELLPDDATAGSS